MEITQSSVLSPQSSGPPPPPQRPVPDHAPPDCAPLIKAIRTVMSRHGIGDEQKAAWVRQLTNGAAENLRACSRWELCGVLELAKLRVGQRPRKFRRGAAETADLAGKGRSKVRTFERPPDRRAEQRAAGIAQIPSVGQLQLIWAIAEELRLSEDEIRGYALQALGLSPLRRQWREDGVAERMARRKKLRDEAFGVRARWPWRTSGEAGKVIDALKAIRQRSQERSPFDPLRVRMFESSNVQEREPGEEG